MTTASTVLSLFMFMSGSTTLAFLSVVFTAAEDTMSASVAAQLCRLGAAAGIRQGQLAADCHNLAACVRVVSLYLFGKLYSIGLRIGVPQLGYIGCACAQVIAVACTLSLPAAAWTGAASEAGGEQARWSRVNGESSEPTSEVAADSDSAKAPSRSKGSML